MAPIRRLGPLLCAAVLHSGLAHGECERVRVDPAPEVVAAWPELPGRIAEALATRPSIDTCAVVRLTLTGRSIGIEVALADGRTAARSVPSGDDVIPALEGLLSMPERELEDPELAPIEEAAPAPDHPPSPAPRPDPWVEDSPPPVDESSSRGLGFDLSAITGLRGGDGPTSGSLGAVAVLDVWDWLLAFDGRAHASHAANRLEVALTVGHRFSPGSLELDVLFGATAELPGFEPVPEERLATDPLPRPNGEPWFTLASRLHLAPRSVVGPFIGGEVLGGVIGPEDVGPEVLQGGDVWMAGLVAGATVRTP